MLMELNLLPSRFLYPPSDYNLQYYSLGCCKKPPISSNSFIQSIRFIHSIRLNSTPYALNKCKYGNPTTYAIPTDLISPIQLHDPFHGIPTASNEFIENKVIRDFHLQKEPFADTYSEPDCIRYGLQMFEEMHGEDVISWTAQISATVNAGYSREGIKFYIEMRKKEIRPNGFTLATTLKACSICSDLDFGKQLHTEVIKNGLFSDVFVGSALVDLYAKCGEIEIANRVFLVMPEKNYVSWNSLLNGYSRSGDGGRILKLFCQMIESEIEFNKFTLSTVLKGCATSGDLKQGKVVHSLAVKTNCTSDQFLSCSLLDMYSKCGLLDDAMKVFLRISDPDRVIWSAMIACLERQGQSREAADLFSRMMRNGVRPNQFTLASIINSATNIAEARYCLSIHACIFKFGYQFENSLANDLIRMYMKITYVQDGYRVFKEIKGKDEISWNSLLSGFHNIEFCYQGPIYFSQMLTEGYHPNAYTFINILRCCSTFLNVNFGKQVHTRIVKSSLDSMDFIGTALIDFYAKINLLEEAEVIFNRMRKRDLFTWTVMISSFQQSDQGEKSLQFFKEMQREGVKPNEFTVASCLSGCSDIAALESGKQFHSWAIKYGHTNDLFVATTLVNMYTKCGFIEKAENVFNSLTVRDTVLWNTIIFGYSQHGQGEKSLNAFKLMLNEGEVPDEITFIGVLSSCSHMGLVEEGKRHYNLMRKINGIKPTMDHYACMIDLLGRAGRFDEVERFLSEMDESPTVLIWKTVLGACKMHGNVELGQKVAEKLFELEPENDSNYVLLSNIFAANGRWDDVKRIRELMSIRGVKKEPGCSWVSVDGQVHVFLSRDFSHPKIEDISLKLEDLSHKLSSSGYVPKIEYVLHNVSESEKKEILLNHSERLALAFALICNKTRTPIRIFKNLRICGDCHDFMKLVSDFIKQEIVVRDMNLFHHFRNGTCSCHDYW